MAVPEALKDIVREFAGFLQLAAVDRPLVLVLDGLDELPPQQRNLRWLPPDLPPGVRVVLSASRRRPAAVHTAVAARCGLDGQQGPDSRRTLAMLLGGGDAPAALLDMKPMSMALATRVSMRASLCGGLQ